MKQRGYSGSWHQAPFKKEKFYKYLWKSFKIIQSAFYKQVPRFKTPFYLAEDKPKNLVLYNCGFKICVYFLSLSTTYNVETPKKQQTVPTFHPVSV